MSLRNKWFKLQSSGLLPTDLLPWLSARTLDDFAGKVEKLVRHSPQTGFPEAVAQAQLAQLAVAFHMKVGTYTAEIDHAQQRLTNNAPTVRSSHQPNIFPSLNILALPALLQYLTRHLHRVATSQSSVQVFFLLDYDIVSDSRFRIAHFPARQARDGYLSIRAPTKRQDANCAMFTLAAPTFVWLESVFDQIRSCLNQEFASVKTSANDQKQYFNNLELCRKISYEALEATSTLTEFNSAFVSRLINCYWRLPTLFIPGHQALKLAEEHFEFLWDTANEIYEAKTEAAELLVVRQTSFVRCFLQKSSGKTTLSDY